MAQRRLGDDPPQVRQTARYAQRHSAIQEQVISAIDKDIAALIVDELRGIDPGENHGQRIRAIAQQGPGADQPDDRRDVLGGGPGCTVAVVRELWTSSPRRSGCVAGPWGDAVSIMVSL